MKKILVLVSCLAFAAACSNNTSEKNTANTEDTVNADADLDSASGAAISATTRQSDMDTSVNNIGTDRTPDAAAAQSNKTAQSNQYEKGATLIANSDCLTCHMKERKVIGPSYVEVAQKYEFNDKNIEYLATKVIEGGMGVWGNVPMSPHPDISKDDAKEMVKYILSLKQ